MKTEIEQLLVIQNSNLIEFIKKIYKSKSSKETGHGPKKLETIKINEISLET